jgi:hypothetical protein
VLVFPQIGVPIGFVESLTIELSQTIQKRRAVPRFVASAAFGQFQFLAGASHVV